MKKTTPEVIREELERICRAAECGMQMVDEGKWGQLDRVARDIRCMASAVKDMAHQLPIDARLPVVPCQQHDGSLTCRCGEPL